MRKLRSRPKPKVEERNDEERRDTFARKQQIMAMFSDNAKTYIQLSGAALGLTLTFAHQILRVPDKENIADGWMITVWICFLVAIVTGAFYQFKAVKLLELEIDWQSSDMWEWLQPGYLYGVMLAAFYSGTIIFTSYAIFKLKHS